MVHLVSSEPLVTTFLSSNHHSTYLALCASLFKASYWTGTVGSLTLTSQPAALQPMPRWSSSYTRFLCKACRSLVPLRTAGSTSGLHLEPFQWQNHKQKRQKGEKWHSIDQERDTCLQYESWNKRAEHRLAQPQQEGALGGLRFFLLLSECPWVTARCHGYWFWIP